MSTEPTPDFTPTPRTTVVRHADRGRYDRSLVYGILDEALVCHVGFVVDGQPFVIPTLHARVGDVLYIHGAASNRMLRTIASGSEICITVTLLDGLVLARSAFSHSMNYRAAMIFGTGREVHDREEKLLALRATVEHVVSGRWADVRHPTEHELQRTLVVAVPLVEASAKIRTGPPKDDEADYRWPVWAGEVPLRLDALAPVPDPRLAPGIEMPEDVKHYSRPGRILHDSGSEPPA